MQVLAFYGKEAAIPCMNISFFLNFIHPFAVVRMNGVVKTDESDSLAGDMPETATGKPNNESSVIQPPGIGPAIHLNGSACPVQDQPLQVCHFSIFS